MPLSPEQLDTIAQDAFQALTNGRGAKPKRRRSRGGTLSPKRKPAKPSVAPREKVPALKPLPDTKLLEQGILARLMREPALLDNGCKIYPGHFQGSDTRLTAETMNHLHAIGGSPDMTNVSLRLDETGDLERVGGRYALTGWAEHESIDIQGDLARLENLSAKARARTLLYRGAENINGMSLEEVAQLGRELQEVGAGAERDNRLTQIMPEPEELWSMLASTEEWPEDIISGLLPVESIMVLYGAPKVGKTILALNLAYHIAAGVDWHSLQIPKPRRVLYISVEGGKRALRARFEAMQGGEVRPPEGSLQSWAVPPFDILNPGHFESLKAAVEAFSPGVIVLDPLIKIHRSEENDNVAMQRVLDQVRSLVTGYGRSLILVHHSAKTGITARGASAIVGDADASIRLEWEDPDEHSGPRRLYFEDIRHTRAPNSLFLTLDPATLTFHAERLGSGALDVILAKGRAMKKKDLVRAIQEAADIGQSRAYGIIAEAATKGKLKQDVETGLWQLK